MDSRGILSALLISCALGAGHGFAPRPKLGNPHIVGGEEVEIEKIPYQLSIRRFLNHHCGASIIGKYYALSAAHCFHERNWMIFYGVAGGSNHVRQGTYKFVRSITSHPEYVHDISDYDVAVVRIWFGFDFSEKMFKIKPVNAGNKLETGTLLVVSGWGKTSEFDSELSEKLLKTEVKVVKQSECKKIYSELTARMFCAGTDDGSHDACYGDSGGPIVEIQSGLQVGIVSWGIGCGNPGRPGVYTDLSYPEISQFVDNNTKNY